MNQKSKSYYQEQHKHPQFSQLQKPRTNEYDQYQDKLLAEQEDEQFLLDEHEISLNSSKDNKQKSTYKESPVKSQLKAPTKFKQTPSTSSPNKPQIRSPIKEKKLEKAPSLKIQPEEVKPQKKASENKTIPQFNPDVRLFKEEDSIESIFDELSLEKTLLNSMQGQTLTLFCFGGANSSKGFNMYGNRDANPGLIRLILETLFSYIYKKQGTSFVVRVSYIEIQADQVNDLLSPNSYKATGQQKSNLTEEICINIEQIFSLIRMGDINRQIGMRQGGDRNSKGHTMFKIIIEQTTRKKSQIRQTIVNLVNITSSEFLPKRNSKIQYENLPQHNQKFVNVSALNSIIKLISEKDQSDVVLYDEEELSLFIQNFALQNQMMVWVGKQQATQQSKFVKQDLSMLLKVKQTLKVLKFQLKRIDQNMSKSYDYSEFDGELEEKMRLDNEIKKIEGQLLNSDKVATFMKKYDSNAPQQITPTSLNRQSTKKPQMADRIGRRIEGAEQFVGLLRMASQKTSKQFTDQNDMESQFESNLQLQSESAMSNMTGRLTALEKALQNDSNYNQDSYIQEQSLLNREISNIDALKDDLLIDDISPSKLENIIKLNDSQKILTSENILSSEGLFTEAKQDSQKQEESNKYQESESQSQCQLPSDSSFGAIEEEENEEDSFEMQLETQRKQRQQEYQKKMDEMDERFGSMMGQSSFATPQPISMVGQFNTVEDQYHYEDDEDLLQNFDGIPRFSLIDLLDQQRDSISKRPTLQFGNKKSMEGEKRGLTNNRNSMLPKNQKPKLGEIEAISEEVDDFKQSFKEADQMFLENLLQTRDLEIQKLKQQLKDSEDKNKRLEKDKEELQNAVDQLERQIQEICGSTVQL